jgi:hypothetical protein
VLLLQENGSRFAMSKRANMFARLVGRFKVEIGLLLSLAGLFTVTAVPL